jgi:HSP20 family protein
MQRRWEEVRNLLSIHERVNKLFEEVMSGSREPVSPPIWSPVVDIYETEKEYVVEAEVPGVKQSDIEISLSDNILTIRGYRPFYPELYRDKSGKYHRVECSYGNFQRSFLLTEPIKENAVKAVLKDGILKITIPKRLPETKQIRVE